MNRLILIVNLLCAICYGQDSASVKPDKFRRFSLGLSLSPDYCFRTLKNTDGSDISQDIMQFDNKIDAPKFGFTTGLAMCFSFTARVSVETGLQYSNRGFATKDLAFVWGNSPPRRGTTSSAPTVSSGHLVYNINYLDIPVKMSFVCGKKKIRFISSAGISANVFLAATNAFVGKYTNGKSFRETSKSTFSRPNEITFSLITSLGMAYEINKRTTLRIEPTFRYALMPVQNSPITATLWSAGLNLGCYLRF